MAGGFDILYHNAFSNRLTLKMKKKILERASHETFYDSIKWVIFGIFAIIYFGVQDRYPLSAISFILLFVIILFFVKLDTAIIKSAACMPLLSIS